MSAEKCYDILDRCNGPWNEEGSGNTLSFFRPANGLEGIALLSSQDNINYDLRYDITIEHGVPVVTLNNRSFNLTVSDDGGSIQLERLGKITRYSLQE